MASTALPDLAVDQALEIVEFLGSTGPYAKFAPGSDAIILVSMAQISRGLGICVAKSIEPATCYAP